MARRGRPKKGTGFGLPEGYEDMIDTRDEDIGIKLQIFWAIKDVRNAMANYGTSMSITQLERAIIALEALISPIIERDKGQIYIKAVDKLAHEYNRSSNRDLSDIIPDKKRRDDMYDYQKYDVVRGYHEKLLFNFLVKKFHLIQQLLDRHNLGLRKMMELEMTDE